MIMNIMNMCEYYTFHKVHEKLIVHMQNLLVTILKLIHSIECIFRHKLCQCILEIRECQISYPFPNSELLHYNFIVLSQSTDACSKFLNNWQTVLERVQRKVKYDNCSNPTFSHCIRLWLWSRSYYKLIMNRNVDCEFAFSLFHVPLMLLLTFFCRSIPQTCSQSRQQPFNKLLIVLILSKRTNLVSSCTWLRHWMPFN